MHRFDVLSVCPCCGCEHPDWNRVEDACCRLCRFPLEDVVDFLDIYVAEEEEPTEWRTTGF